VLGNAGSASKIMTPTGEVTVVTDVTNILNNVAAEVLK
jgi:hypothetical protein